MVKPCYIKTRFKTDHACVVLNIESLLVPRGPGYLKKTYRK